MWLLWEVPQKILWSHDQRTVHTPRSSHDYVCICMYMYVYAYMYMHIHTYVYMHIHACICIYTYVYAQPLQQQGNRRQLSICPIYITIAWPITGKWHHPQNHNDHVARCWLVFDVALRQRLHSINGHLLHAPRYQLSIFSRWVFAVARLSVSNSLLEYLRLRVSNRQCSDTAGWASGL